MLAPMRPFLGTDASRGRSRGRAAASVIAAGAIGGLILSGCGRPHPPPSPTTSFRPEIIGIVTNVKSLECGVSRVELASGDRVDLDLAGSSLSYDTPCPGTDSSSAWRAFGDNDADTAKERIFLSGHDTNGAAWYGWATPTEGCAAGTYGVGVGAWDEGESFHLGMGVVLDKAADFRVVDPPRSFVTADGALCVNGDGAVTATWEPPVG